MPPLGQTPSGLARLDYLSVFPKESLQVRVLDALSNAPDVQVDSLVSPNARVSVVVVSLVWSPVMMRVMGEVHGSNVHAPAALCLLESFGPRGD